MSKNRPHWFRAVAIQYLVGIAVVACMLIQACYLKAAPEVADKKNAKDGNPKRLSPAIIAEIWTKIKSAEAPQSPNIKEGSPEAWLNVIKVGFAEMQKIIKSSNPREGLEYYVHQFGKQGAQADMRWLLALRTWGLAPDRSLNPHREDKITHNNRRVQLISAELQVRLFLKDPKLLARYYHSVIWYGYMFNDLFYPVRLGQVYRNMKADSPDDNYWWYAQNFVLMAHATGRDDLLKGAKPEDLKPRFQQWYHWFMQNGMYLRASPDTFYWSLEEKGKKIRKVYFPFVSKQELPPLKVLPIYPFPDWKGPKPTTPQNYWSME